MRCSRSSWKYEATTLSSLRKPPVRTSFSAGARGHMRSSGESKLVSMKFGSSSSYSWRSQSENRPNAAASVGPQTWRISSVIRSRPCHTRRVEPSS
jgi:hypothetical protein